MSLLNMWLKLYVTAKGLFTDRWLMKCMGSTCKDKWKCLFWLTKTNFCWELRHLSSQVTVVHDGALLSWERLNTCLLMWSSEWMPHFFFAFFCAAFVWDVKLPLSHPTGFLIFTLLALFPPSDWGQGDWASNCVGFSCLLGLKHNCKNG